jgi:tetratricopeptide (TPR) repeat protein
MYQMWDPGARIEERNELVAEGVEILHRLGARRALVRIAQEVAWTYSPERDAEAVQVLQEGLAFCREVGDVEGVSNVLPALGELAVRRGAYDEAERYGRETFDLAEKAGTHSGTGYASYNLAKIAYFRGDYAMARQLYQDALDDAEQAGHRHHVAMVGSFLGDTALAMGDYEGARERHRQAGALCEEMGVYWGETASGQHYGTAYSLDRLGDVALAAGELGQAREYYRQALQIAREHPQAALNLDVVASQAALVAREGRGERAVELAALALHHPGSNTEVKRSAQRLLDRLAAEVPPDVFAAAQERGRAKDLWTTAKELAGELAG